MINNSASHDTEISTSSNIRNYVSMNIYYVYAYLRNKDSSTASANTPYYIGKGKGRRMYEKHKVNLPRDYKRIQIIDQQLSESEAVHLEILLIAKYGRKDIGTGILRNRTNGGEGTAGRITSASTKEKISAANLGRQKSSSHKEKLSKSALGRPTSQLQKETASNIHKGKVTSAKTKELMRVAALTRAKTVCVHCNKEFTNSMYVRWHGPKCKLKN